MDHVILRSALSARLAQAGATKDLNRVRDANAELRGPVLRAILMVYMHAAFY